MTKEKLKDYGFTTDELEDIKAGLNELGIELEDVIEIELYKSKKEYCMTYIERYCRYEEFLLDYLNFEKLFEALKDNTYVGEGCIIDFEL
ncbi:MAG TPA: hypothetical protein ENG48_03370 [Candidatus Atribacteria bacterium]|nr:hypothetical protein [Candidatus Atribacteria bacterium]